MRKANPRFFLSCLFTLLLCLLITASFGCGDDDDDDDSSSAPDDDDDDDNDDDNNDDDNDDNDDDDDTYALETHTPYFATENILPQGVESCGVIADTQCVGNEVWECAIYDSATSDFPALPPEFVERIYYQDRYHDRYLRSEHSGVTFRTQVTNPPGTSEEDWAGADNFERYSDFGDGAFYMSMYLSAAAMRYAVTGTDADYDRMKELLNSQLMNWRVTGVPGYMVRTTFAMLDDGVSIPPGHPEYSLHEYKTRDNHVLYEVTGDQLQYVPSYYHQGVTIDTTFYNTTPLSEGSPSLDHYSASFVAQEKAWSLLKDEDQELKDEIVDNVTCFLKRMRKIRIRNLSTSFLGKLAVTYLTSSSSFHPDPDDINLEEVDTLIGYVQEAIPPNPNDPGDFEFGCPDSLPTEVDPKYDFDANSVQFVFQLIDLAAKMAGEGDHSIDFIYFVSHRGGDTLYLLNYATFAYHATGEKQYLDFIRQNLIEEVDGLEVVNTAGSFYLNPYCGSWIGGDLIHPVIYGMLNMIGQDVLADEVRRALIEEFKDKLFANDNNAYFGVTYGAVMDSTDDPDVQDYIDWAVDELANYMHDPNFPLDPKRKYDQDYVSNPLPDSDYWPVAPTQAQVDECETGFEILGIEVFPGPGVDPDFEVLSENPLPVQYRVPHDLIWHFSPFNLKRIYGWKHGRDHLMFADLTMPFWIARYFNQIDSGDGMALAWKNTGQTCP